MRRNYKFTELLFMVTLFAVGFFGGMLLLFLFKASVGAAIMLGIATTFLVLIGVMSLAVTIILKVIDELNHRRR